MASRPVLRDFAFAMVVGNIFGTYSSIGVAAPLVFEYQVRFAGKKVSAPVVAGGPTPTLKLKDGGRLILPVGDYVQELKIVTRIGSTFEERNVLGVTFVPMTGQIRKD